MTSHDVLITGVGLVSSLGVGVDAHWSALTAHQPQPVLETERFAPYTVHPLPQIDWSAQIAKRGDQRQMETWQRLGTYTAGLALDDAGIGADDPRRASMDMIVAAGGGERDEAVDTAILSASSTRNDTGVLLNEKLTTELRPTLFLAQLSNLLAGNISIVHKVIGSSRTFMGEEGAGVAAIETAAARIRSGQSSHILVGGAFQTEHPDMLLGYELGGYLHRSPWTPVWRRVGEGGGMVSGSGAAFLVLESREHAEARGRRAYATIEQVVSANSRRDEGLSSRLTELLARINAEGENILVVSAASGATGPTAAERLALDKTGLPYRGVAGMVGHIKEAMFPFSTALAALSVCHGTAYPPFDPECEAAGPATIDKAIATAIGYRRFEGVALLSHA